ncbi:hypothetical protein [Paenibacillus rhizophilus]|uniref:Uncharacterized protein n=1 Tax=Paenibacillus rhizophilus TaxID=1850366 RepID=A0A3N9P2M0_9BACL|nr:hypothetical protein [Paenibacillus rhizophilus]RQW10035.1 hypothetical protein EH198_16505 [Paenibacillus rhizophilus]
MAKQGQKLTDELKEQIKAHLVLGDNKNDVAKKLGVSWSTVQKIAKEVESNPEEKESFEKLREDKKQEVITRIWEGFINGIELGNKMIKEALDGEREIPLNQLSTYNGTMYDKMALMKGDPTANTNINGSMTFKQDLKKLSPEELKNLENLIGKVADA